MGNSLNEIKKIFEGQLFNIHGAVTFTREDAEWLIEQAKLVEKIKDAYKDREDDIHSLEGSLREIDNYIRSTKEPIKHIIKVLKDTLPEYQGEFY